MTVTSVCSITVLDLLAPRQNTKHGDPLLKMYVMLETNCGPWHSELHWLLVARSPCWSLMGCHGRGCQRLAGPLWRGCGVPRPLASCWSPPLSVSLSLFVSMCLAHLLLSLGFWPAESEEPPETLLSSPARHYSFLLWCLSPRWETGQTGLNMSDSDSLWGLNDFSLIWKWGEKKIICCLSEWSSDFMFLIMAKVKK